MSDPAAPLPKGILVAVDGSEPSQRAALYALAMAVLAKSHLFALNVVLLPRGASRDIVENLRVDLNAKAQEIVAAVSKNAESAHVADCEGRVLETDRSVVETITSFAKEKEVELIVLGTKG